MLLLCLVLKNAFNLMQWNSCNSSMGQPGQWIRGWTIYWNVKSRTSGLPFCWGDLSSIWWYYDLPNHNFSTSWLHLTTPLCTDHNSPQPLYLSTQENYLFKGPLFVDGMPILRSRRLWLCITGSKHTHQCSLRVIYNTYFNNNFIHMALTVLLFLWATHTTASFLYPCKLSNVLLFCLMPTLQLSISHWMPNCRFQIQQ